MARTPARAKPAPRPNPHRGEVVWNGYKLCLTTNALVEIEEGLGANLATIGKALAAPSMKQLRTILAALVRGGGAKVDDGEGGLRPPTDEEVGESMLNIPEATAAIEAAFSAAGAFTPTKEEQAPTLGN